eukprot:Hpha_TRINITY_DN17170_c0_g1::TRINITY_DN17170_c0_g1_i1::g.146664::m.146664
MASSPQSASSPGRSPYHGDDTDLPDLPAEFEGSFGDLLRRTQDVANIASDVEEELRVFGEWLNAPDWQAHQPVWRCSLPSALAADPGRAFASLRQGLGERTEKLGEVLLLRQRNTVILFPVQRVAMDFIRHCSDGFEDSGGVGFFAEKAYAEAGLFAQAGAQRMLDIIKAAQEAEEGPKLPEPLRNGVQVTADYGTLLASATDAGGILRHFQRSCLAAAQQGEGTCSMDYCVAWHRRDGVGRTTATAVARSIRTMLTVAKLAEASVTAADRGSAPGQKPRWVVQISCEWRPKQKFPRGSAPRYPSQGADKAVPMSPLKSPG